MQQVFTSGFGYPLPFLLADPLQFCQVSPEMLNWVKVRVLAGPLKNSHLL